MSHITIIISKAATSMEDLSSGTTYEYRIPVPHDATPAQVGQMTRQAYRHLEGHSVSEQGGQEEE